MGYVFKGRYDREAPRERKYTFQVRVKDDNNQFGEATKLTIEHPGIQKLVLQQQDVTGLIAGVKIKLPPVFSQVSQKVYPGKNEPEEKDIIGYRLFITEVDEENNPIGNQEVINVPTDDLKNNTYFYQGETGKRYSIRVGAYDSVYHYNFNKELFNQTLSDPIYVRTFMVDFIDIDPSLISPDDLTETLRNPPVDVSEMQSEYTWIVGKDVNGNDIVGGIGLRVNEEQEKVDVQFVADSFRLFPTDNNGEIVEGEDTAVFAVDTTDGASTIFLDANQVGIRASRDDGSGEYNFFVLDEDGLEIFTKNFQLDNQGNALFKGEIQSEKFSLVGGNVQIDNDGVKVFEDNGDYSYLSSEGLAFYKNGVEIPNYYAKRIASGVNEGGDYIELNWEKEPKVLTSLTSVDTYNPDYPDYRQFLLTGTENKDKNGFKLIGNLMVEGNEEKNDMGVDLRYTLPKIGSDQVSRQATLYSEYSDGEDITRISFDLVISSRHFGSGSDNVSYRNEWKVYYRGTDGVRQFYKKYNNSGYYNVPRREIVVNSIPVTIEDLPRDSYRIEIYFNHAYGVGTDVVNYMNVKNITSYGDKALQKSQVSWIAIEGGSYE